ncbi:MAG: hypothetical protein GX567_19040 [Clostridia bacterium]|nr:hypothetical protein [Clostridia bacterium]
MGYGSYQASDWEKLRNSRGINQASGAGDIFQHEQLEDRFDPKLITYRESRDSDDSPEATPIIIGFDVTGSMGYLAAEIAKNSLNKTVTEIYDKQPVTNPHILCAPFTGPYNDAPLQVTQFEADIRIVEQLLDMWVGFGGNKYSYDSLVWYFAAKHTKTDCYDKHNKKAFLFCIGDEVCGGDDDILTTTSVKKIYGDDITADLTLSQIRNMASEKYEIFHIVTAMSNNGALDTWQKFLPGRVADLDPKNIEYLGEVIISIMQLANGMERCAVISQWPEEVQSIVSKAIGTIDVKPMNKRQNGISGFFRRIFGK